MRTYNKRQSLESTLPATHFHYAYSELQNATTVSMYVVVARKLSQTTTNTSDGSV
jgi:hypothetical protein